METTQQQPNELEQQGDVTLDFAFTLHARYDEAVSQSTPSGILRYQSIIGGEIRGRRLNGSVYPSSGGQYDTVRADEVRLVDAHFIINADNGEHIYIEHFGYRRAGGYYRAIAYLDADVAGPYDWVNDTTFVVTAAESPDQRRVLFSYYAAD